MNYSQRFQVSPGTTVKLKDIDPGFKDRHESHKEAAEELEQDRAKLLQLQELLYADGKRSLLICLQGMDTAGKDGTINHILGAMDPQGCRVAAFKQPSAEEASHDFFGEFIPRCRATDRWQFSIALTTKTYSSFVFTTWCPQRSGLDDTTASTALNRDLWTTGHTF